MKRKLLITAVLALFVIGAKAQKYGATPEDSLECIKNISLYQDYYKQKAYDDALVFWRNIYSICPKCSKSIYQKGAKMYEMKIKENKENPDVREGLVDTLLMIMDSRIEHFGERGKVLSKKAIYMIKYRKNEPDKAYAVFEEAFELQGNKMSASSLVYMYKTRYAMYRKKMCTKADVISLYPTLKAVVDYNVANGSDKSKEKYRKSGDNLLEFFKRVAECPDLVEAFKPRFDANKDDTKMMNDILTLLNAKECEDTDFYIEVARRLQELEPSPRAAYSIANWYAGKGECSNAIDYYLEAFALADSMPEADKAPFKVKSGLSSARCYLATKQFAKVKLMAKRVLAIDPDNGDAYMLIGDAYLYGGSACGDNDCAKKAGYWAAVDKYQVARAKDPSLAEKVNPKIGKAKAQYPKKEDCFFYGINEGADFKIGCWINETVKVRFN
ncbi:hypothetical protein KFE98_06260 [bacterium SCSIO 12741]|nr:hypothetical protein KFE98_06260 [bacterium SCSIO 12741]